MCLCQNRISDVGRGFYAANEEQVDRLVEIAEKLNFNVEINVLFDASSLGFGQRLDLEGSFKFGVQLFIFTLDAEDIGFMRGCSLLQLSDFFIDRA